jgi:hypothetical protein
VLDLENNMNQSIDSVSGQINDPYDQAHQMIEATIGDRVYTRADHANVACRSGQPLEASIDEIRRHEKQVIIYSGACNEAWGEFLFTREGTHAQSGAGSFIDKQASLDTQVNNCGIGDDVDSKWTRVYEDATLVGRIATDTPRLHNADEVAEMAKCGINMPSLDYLHPDDPRLQAFVWGWDVDQPSAVGDCAVLNTDGRIEVANCFDLPQLKACLASDNSWSVGANCDLTSFSVPANGKEMFRLVKAANGNVVALNYQKIDGIWTVPANGLSTLTTKDVAVDKGKMLIFTPTLDAPTAAAIKVIYELQHWSSC